MGPKAGIVVATAVLFLCAASASVQSQDLPSAEVEGSGGTDDHGKCMVVGGTFVDVAILDPITSAMAKRGQRFRIELLAPLRVDGFEVLPVGTVGEGEVIHADRSRGGGKPGELLLAARHLDHAGQRIGLRGMKMGGSGDDRLGAALATSMAIGPFAHFIRGREIEIPAGTPAHARLSADLSLPCSPDAVVRQPAPASDDASIQVLEPISTTITTEERP